MTPAGVLPAQAGIQAPKRIGVFGAAGTGKTRLVSELSAALAGRDFLVAETPAVSACDVALLLGLDLPSSAGREADDARIRAQLQAAGLFFQVVYGPGAQRLQSALLALGVAQRNEDDEGRAWNWVCEKCSDPACEHRLFSRLKEAR